MKKLRILLILGVLVVFSLLVATTAYGGQEKVTICHKPGTPAEGTLQVAAAAVQAHLDHGDTLGECGVVTISDLCDVVANGTYDSQYIEATLTGVTLVGDERLLIQAEYKDELQEYGECPYESGCDADFGLEAAAENIYPTYAYTNLGLNNIEIDAYQGAIVPQGIYEILWDWTPHLDSYNVSVSWNSQHELVLDSTVTCEHVAPKIVFITREAWYGDLREPDGGDGYTDGLSGADEKCQAAAENAGLTGTYKAWLSDSTGSPATRFTTKWNGPYVGTDGTIIANDWNDLTTLNEDSNTEYLQEPITLDENGDSFSQADNIGVWSATEVDGSYNGISTCDNWTLSTSGYSGGGPSDTGYYGNPNYITVLWTRQGYRPCGPYTAEEETITPVKNHLFCFEQ